MASEYTLYTSMGDPLKLGKLFSELLRCHPVPNDFPGTWSYSSEWCTLDVMSDLGESFEDQARLIGATPTAVIFAPRKRLHWNDQTTLLRVFISQVMELWTAEIDSTGAILANDELLLAAKLPDSSIELDNALFDPEEFGQTGEFEQLPAGGTRTNLSASWPLPDE